MHLIIEQWDGEYESACQMFDVVELCLPLQSKMDRAHAVSFLEKMQQPFPNSTLVAKKHGQVVATAMLYAGPNDQVACMVGAVHPSLRKQGVGTELLSILVGHLERYPQRRQLQANAFQSNSDGIRFLQKRGFAEVDRLHWLSRPTDLAFADWLLDKEKALERSALRVVVATEFETLRDDWDVAWWKAKTAMDADIPSATPFAEIPFEEWKGYLSPPFLNRHHALDGTRSAAGTT